MRSGRIASLYRGVIEVRRLSVAVVRVARRRARHGGRGPERTSKWAPVRYKDPVFSAVKLVTDITYGSAVDQTGTRDHLELDMYAPKGDTVTNRAAIVWVHGGGVLARRQDVARARRRGEPVREEGLRQRLDQLPARAGGLRRRRSTPSCLDGIIEAMQDAQTAVRFLRSHAAAYGIDPTRIAMGGSSAGAITALNVGYNAADPGPGAHQEFSSAVEAVQSLSGAAIGTTPGADGAPAILFHGTADPLVPYAWAQATVQEARDRRARRGARHLDRATATCRTCSTARRSSTRRRRSSTSRWISRTPSSRGRLFDAAGHDLLEARERVGGRRRSRSARRVRGRRATSRDRRHSRAREARRARGGFDDGE